MRQYCLVCVDPILCLSMALAVPGLGRPIGDPPDNSPVGASTIVGMNDCFYLELDAMTGAATAVSGVGLAGFSLVISLAFDSEASTLYGLDGPSNLLITIDPTTGVGTAVGPVGLSFVADLAFDSQTGRLYGSTLDRLMTIDAATGAGTAVGPLGSSSVRGLAFDANSNTLYGTDTDIDHLITIDPETGAGTDVGALGFSDVEGLTFDSCTNTLYG